MELFFLYMWLKLDAILCLLLGLAVACLVLMAISAIAIDNVDVYASREERRQTASTWQKRRNRFFVASVPLFMLATFMPTKTDVAVLVGASMAIKFANSPEGAKVSTLLRGKANEILDKELKKLNPVN
jgi:hypothetical protein